MVCVNAPAFGKRGGRVESARVVWWVVARVGVVGRKITLRGIPESYIQYHTITCKVAHEAEGCVVCI